MKTDYRTLVATPEALRRAGFYFDPPPVPTQHRPGAKGAPSITAACEEYREAYKNGKPPIGTLKMIAAKHNVLAHSIASRLTRDSCK